MPGAILTVASAIQCQHGGAVILTTANVRVKAGGAFALLETDVHPVAGCPFTVGPKYSPCVRVEWSAGAALVKASAPVLVQSSIGKCISAENAPQGVAIIGGAQPKVSAR